MKKARIIIDNWRLFSLPLGIFFLVLVLAFLVLIPRIKIILQLKVKAKATEERLVRLTAKISDLEGLDAVGLAEKRDLVLKAIPRSKEVMNVVNLISGLADKTQIKVESIQVSPGEISTESGEMKKLEEVETLPFHVVVEGENEKIFEFLELLEKSLPLIFVNSFKFGKTAGVSRAEIALESYSSFLPKTLGKIDSPLVKIDDEEEKIFKILGDFESYSANFVFSPSSPSEERENPFSF